MSIAKRSTIEVKGADVAVLSLNNPGFNPIEFDGIRKQADLNSFILTAKRWIDATGAIGLISKSGRYGGTYAHKDITFEFASWVSVEFKLYLIKEDENRQFTDLGTNQVFSSRDFRAVPAKYRKPIPEYVKDVCLVKSICRIRK